MNISHSMGPVLGGSATPANLNSDGFPSGVLPGTLALSQIGMPQNYFGHYSMLSVGNAGLNMAFVPPLIVYNGGNAVLSVSPSNTGVSSAGGAGIGLLPNGNWNVEFAFGDTITTVQNSPTTPGLIRIISASTGFLCCNFTGDKVQIHNVSGIDPSTVWTITKISSNTADLQGSVWNAGMVPATGAPGVAAEAIVQVSSIQWNWWQSTTGFSNINYTISSWIFCKTADLPAVQAGQNISLPAVNSMTTLKPKWLRVMDMVGVQGTSGQFQYLPQSTAQAYGSSRWLPDYYGGTTSGTGDDYAVNPGPASPTSGPYADGEVIQFKTDRASVGQLATLSINGRSTGAKPVLLNSSHPISFVMAAQPSGSAITSISGSGTLATVTTTANHGFATGQKFITNIGGNTPSTFNGSNVLATTTGVNTFTYSNTTSGSASVAGTFTPQVADGDIVHLTFTGSGFSGGAYTFDHYVNLAPPSYSATASGKIMTVTAIPAGTITPGLHVTGSGLSNSPIILPYGSGGTTGTGGTGTYALDISPTGTTTLTGSTSATAASCGGGTVNSVSSLIADMACDAGTDPILGGQGVLFGNDSSTSSVSIVYAPAVAPITPSATITAAGGTAETVTPSYGGKLATSTLYTAQYRALQNGWTVNSGGLQVGVPLAYLKEYAQRSGAGIYYNIQMAWTQASAQAFGTYLANNYGSIPVAITIANELWNSGQVPNHASQNLGASMGFTGVGGSVYFQSTYGYYSWAVENILQTVVNSYVAAGGNRNNIFITLEMSGADGAGCPVGATTCNGGQTGAVQTLLQSRLLTPTPATFTGTITPNTNGRGATLAVSGISGSLYPGFQINGAGVTAGTHISACLPAFSNCTGNGTYQLDTIYASPVGPITMTATNVIYSAVGGWAATPTTNDFTAFPNRVADVGDAVAYATYWGGNIAVAGAGSWNGSQTPFIPFFQAAADYAQGVATSNNTLIQNALNVWSADVNGQTVLNKTGKSGIYSSNNECGFLSSPTTFGFCGNVPDAVITGSTGGTSTLTVTNVASGTIVPGMRIGIPGSNTVPIILPYGTGGTTGTGGVGTYALSIAFTPGVPISNTAIGYPVGTVQGWENIVAAFDSARPAGKAKLGIIQYEGSLQQAFCSGSCVVGNISIAADAPTLATQFTNNGWNLDPTYGYPGFGSGNLQTATNVISLFLGYVNSTQYYNDELFMLQSQATIHAARPFFSPAQYGIEGPIGNTATTGAPQWGLYPGDLSTAPLQNYNAQAFFNTNWLLRRDIDPASNDNDPMWLEKAA